MTAKPKLLFDECIGWPLIEQLATLLGLTGQEAELNHAVRMGFGGVDDAIWIPQIALDDWVIITGDRGAQSKASKPKMPAVCRQYSVTHAMLSRSVCKRNSFGKMRALFAVWDSLLTLHLEPKGSGFSIRATNAGNVVISKLYEGIPLITPRIQTTFLDAPRAEP